MGALTVEERNVALVYAKNGADFMFVPSFHLCDLMASGSPETIGVNKTLVAILLSKRPIRLDTNTVVKYCKGTLDSKNTWLFDHGDIKVVPARHKRPELLKKDDDSDNSGYLRIADENKLEENGDE